jgi:hypothetical protein
MCGHMFKIDRIMSSTGRGLKKINPFFQKKVTQNTMIDVKI